MTKQPWTCLTSSCDGRVAMVSTEGAKVEGKWRVPGCECLTCHRAHVASKAGLYLVRSTQQAPYRHKGEVLPATDTFKSA